MRQDARVKYPWAQWLKGEVNEHTPANTRAFRNYLYEWAKRNEMYVNATVDGESVRFQFFDTIEQYQAGRQFSNAPQRNSVGQFLEKSDAYAVNRRCSICTARLTPMAPEDATECYRYDFTTNQLIRVHESSTGTITD